MQEQKPKRKPGRPEKSQEEMHQYLTITLSPEVKAYLKGIKNKSGFINKLVKEQLKGLQAMTHTPIVSYERLQVIFDEMFNHSMVCTEENMVQYIRDNSYPESQWTDLEEVIHTFFEETCNG